MNSGEAIAWHYEDRGPFLLRWKEGVITTLERAETIPPYGFWMAPTLVDVQVNGFAGVDFQRDGLTEAGLLKATRALRDAACSHYLLTLITDEWTRLLARLRHLKALRDANAELKQAIFGWHVEGPFLSAEPGFRGAHNPDAMCDPTPDHISQLKQVTQDDPVLLTIAPERSGAVETVRAARQAGFRVSFGHTNAPQKAIGDALLAGGTAFTHLGNGCPQQLDRHDNILWRVLDLPGLTIGLIPDKIHVSPLLFRLVHRLVERERIYYTTDAMSAAGAPPGRYSIGRLELEVGEDRVVRLPGSPNFAGSSLTPVEAPFFAGQMRDVMWQDCWDHISRFPARFMGLKHEFAVGEPANFCLFSATEANTLTDLKVYYLGVPQ